MSQGGLFSSIYQIVMGKKQEKEGKKIKAEGEQLYQKARGEIETKNDPLQVSAFNEAARLQKSYKSGAELDFANKEIDNSLSTASNKVSQISGGNTGSAMSSIANMFMNSAVAKNKAATDATAQSNQMFGVKTQMGNAITARNDSIDQKYQDFDIFRGSQKYTEGAGLMKTGQENVLGGVTNLNATIRELIRSVVPMAPKGSVDGANKSAEGGKDKGGGGGGGNMMEGFSNGGAGGGPGPK